MSRRTSSSVKVLEKAIKERSSVVYILHGNGNGSGFVIRYDGTKCTIMTCQHVLRGFKPGDTVTVRYTVQVGGVKELSGTVLFISRDHIDVALVQVAGLSCMDSLSFTETNLVVGEKVIAIGYCNPDELWKEEALSRLPASSPGHVM